MVQSSTIKGVSLVRFVLRNHYTYVKRVNQSSAESLRLFPGIQLCFQRLKKNLQTLGTLKIDKIVYPVKNSVHLLTLKLQ